MLGGAQVVRARALARTNGDFTEPVAVALKAFEKAAELDPSSDLPLIDEAEVSLFQGQQAASAGRDPGAFYDATEAALQHAQPLDPKNAHESEVLAALFEARAEWKRQRHQDAARDIKAGMTAAEEALRLDPTSAVAEEWKSLLAWMDGQTIPAQTAFHLALSRNPLLSSELKTACARVGFRPEVAHQ